MKAINVCLPIICLLVISCKKEEKSLSSASITIGDVSAYAPSQFYINSTVYTLNPINDTLHLDINGDSINDLKVLTWHDYHHGPSTWLDDFKCWVIPIDTTLWEVSVLSDTNMVIAPHTEGDIIDENCIWKSFTAYYQIYREWDDLNGSYIVRWNDQDTSAHYIGIRKRVGSNYKYGFIKQTGWPAVQAKIGPLVLQN